MEKLEESLKIALKKKGIRPTYQRIKILQFLMRKDSHPTADEIFQHLTLQIPTLSRATIYNTLHLLTEVALVRALSFNDMETRYDATIAQHGHFKCGRCGRIFNFTVDIDEIPFNKLDKFVITQKDVYFKGYCPNCTDQKD